MSQIDLHPEVVEFISSLTQRKEILRENDTPHWVEQIRRIKVFAEKSDGCCVPQFLQLFGGMGFLNDIVLIASDEINEAFNLELDRAYLIAKNLEKTA